MKIKHLFLISLSVGMLACGDESADKTSGGKGSDAKGEAATGATGNKFFDSAVKKIAALDAEVSPVQAARIVTLMTADGSIGLGEINGMNLQDLTKNSDALQAAYARAKTTALGE